MLKMKSDEKALFEMKSDEKALSDEELKSFGWIISRQKSGRKARQTGLAVNLNPNGAHQEQLPKRAVAGDG